MPDVEKFKTFYETKAAKREVLVLQGHPDQWDDKRWEGFTKIIDFLKSKKAAQVQNPAAPAKAPEVSRFSQKSNVVGYIPFKVSFGLTPLGLQDRSLREGYHRSALEDRSRTGRILGV